ncbi:MAG: transporter permease [Nocardioides sp.]|nr:transporter permease [Nocardioides sp.]
MTRLLGSTRDAQLAAGLLVVLLGTWELLARLGVLTPETAPAPSVIASAGSDLVAGGLFFDVRITLTYVLVAFVLALVLGVGLGLLLSSWPLVAQVSVGFLTFLLSVPKSLFLPLFILVIGIGGDQKVAFGAFSSFAVVVMATMVGIASVDANLVTMARSQGARRREVFLKIYLRSMTPTLLEAARIAMILNITGVLIAEMYVSRQGLGYLVNLYGQTFQVAPLLAVIAVITVIGIALNELLRWCERRQDRWREGI